jgi:hypothetical protein
MLFAVKALPTVVIRAAHTMAAHMMASSLCFLIFAPTPIPTPFARDSGKVSETVIRKLSY